ncbi:hypothetical protein K439DRAFT_1612896 [Ramaria rubella]|nr:hypothetical protein K439DRAFT_1612896 [Ramaria rubella]
MLEIENFVNAKKAWTHLKTKTHQAGIVSKLNATHTTICTHFVSHSTFSSTIAEIKDLIATIYDEQEPTCEEWTIVLLLQAPSDGEFEWIRKNLMSFITTSTTTLSSDDIITRLETEAQDTHTHDMIKAQDTMLATRHNLPKSTKSTIKCSNCNSHGHTIENCWEKGGRSVGKAPEWWKSAKDKHDGDKKKRESKGKSTQAKAMIDNNSSGSESRNVLIAKDTVTNSSNWSEVCRHFLNCPADGDISCSVVEKCSITWDKSTTCNFSLAAEDIQPLTTDKLKHTKQHDTPFTIDSA